jgi:putative holliday junction resolvase
MSSKRTVQISPVINMNSIEYYLGIDYGETRIGLALANSIARLPSAYGIVLNDKEILRKLAEIAENERIDKIIVGLPRNMSGQETGQSKVIRQFADDLSRHTAKPIVFSDESLSSVRAAGSKNYKPTSAKHKDDIAACYILEEFLK